MNEYLSRENEQKLGVIPTQATLNLTDASTEYSYTVPSHTKRIIIKMRTISTAFLYGWATGDLNVTVPAGFVRDISDVHLQGRTMFFRNNEEAGTVLEIESFQ